MTASPASPSSQRLRAGVRMGLGLILLVAAGLKGHQLGTERIVSTGLLDARPALAATVGVEALLGAWLVSGLLPALAARTAAAAFAVFAAVALAKVSTGQSSCGCFGRVSVPPWASLSLDLLAAPLALWVGLGRRGTPCCPRLRAAALAVVVVGLIVPGFVRLAFFPPPGRPDVTQVVLEPAGWPGRPWLLGEYIDTWPQLARGRWVVLLYAPSCGDCAPTVGDYAALARDWQAAGRPERIALIDTTGDPPHDDLRAVDLGATPAVRGRLVGPSDWFIPSPTLVILSDGRVLATAEGYGNCDWDDGQFNLW